MSQYPFAPAGAPGASGSYSYGTYPPNTPGAFPSTGVQSYGSAPWPASYSYFPQQGATTTAAATAASTAGAASTSAATSTPSTPAPRAAVPSTPTIASASSSYAPAPVPPRTYPTYNASSYVRDGSVSASTHAGRAGGRSKPSHKGLFAKELRSLMYGFGDDRNPANDTVNVMEEILIEYIIDVCQTAAGPTRKTRLSVEDLRRALSRPADAKKLARMEELLFMQEDIKRARAQFDDGDMTKETSSFL